MRLCIIIPAYNEAKSLGSVLSGVPVQLPGISHIQCIVIDDGSTDSTVQIAQSSGALVISHQSRLGLAAAFRTGLKTALSAGADIMCTLDADGQYRAHEIALLWDEMCRTHVDLVVGNRCVFAQRHMPFGNRMGNVIGSLMLRMMGVTKIRDASSGFRIFTSKLAQSLRIMSRHTYTHEMLIQADAHGFTTAEAPVTFLPRPYGKSKLVRSLHHHILRSCGTIIRSTFLLKPLRKFLFLSLFCVMVSGIISVYAFRDFTVHFSIIFLAILFAVVGLQFLILGIIAEAYAADRRVAHEQGAFFQQPL